MIYFFDSSAVVKRYVQEAGSAWVKQLTALAVRNYVYIAEITGAEVLSALTRQGRSGALTPTHRTLAITKFRLDFDGLFYRVEISRNVVYEAMQLAELHFLRGYDAVQLAAALTVSRNRQVSAHRPSLTFVSADTALNAAASAEGLLVDDPNAHP